MEFVLQDVFNATAEIGDSGNHPDLRLFTVADHSSSVYLNDTINRFPDNASWVVTSPKYTNGSEWLYFSAVCWLYGRDLYVSLGGQVPIGLIETCYGGTPIITWSDVDAINQCGLPEQDETALSTEQIQVSKSVSNFLGPHGPKAPYLLWNAMVQPLINYKLKTILWYQGENDASNSTAYACRFPALIESWRRHWQQPNLPFYFVLLAGYLEGVAQWAPTRAAQLVALQLPYVEVATAHDLGDMNNTAEGDIHSRNKSILATRLTALALYNQYGQTDVIAYGPVVQQLLWPEDNYNSQQVTIALVFLTNGTQGRYAAGLHLLGTAECTTCCSLDGSPVQWVLSNGQTIRVPVTVQQDRLIGTAILPVGVQVLQYWFNYEAYPQCSLYNNAGFPALPFASKRPSRNISKEPPAEEQQTNTVYQSGADTVSANVFLHQGVSPAIQE